MTSPRKFRLHLHLVEGAFVLTVAALATGAVSTRQLLLDAANRPTSDISLASAHWLGTLDPARLPASLALDPSGNAATRAGGYLDLTAGGSIKTGVNGSIDTTDYGGFINTSGSGGTVVTSNSGGSLDLSNDGGNVTTGSGGGNVSTAGSGGAINTSSGGGYIQTNGYGAPADASAPLGSLYADQDPDGGSGHVLWVMEPAGWVGK